MQRTLALGKEAVQYGWITLNALEARRVFLNAPSMAGVKTTVSITRMLVLFVQVSVGLIAQYCK